MTTLPSRAGGLTTQEVGYFDQGYRRISSWLHEGLSGNWRVRLPDWICLDDAILHLKPGTTLSRYACISLGGWTLVLNNSPNGTDVGVLPSQAARELGCRAIRAVCAPDEGPGFAARVLEVYGPGGQPPLAIERSIVAADDGGRWIFEISGKPFVFEKTDMYQKHVKAQRFSCGMLHDYLRHLGVPPGSQLDWTGAVVIEDGQI
jgi:hypothetical protein